MNLPVEELISPTGSWGTRCEGVPGRKQRLRKVKDGKCSLGENARGWERVWRGRNTETGDQRVTHSWCSKKVRSPLRLLLLGQQAHIHHPSPLWNLPEKNIFF